MRDRERHKETEIVRSGERERAFIQGIGSIQYLWYWQVKVLEQASSWKLREELLAFSLRAE